jgi:hypothetical protein
MIEVPRACKSLRQAHMVESTIGLKLDGSFEILHGTVHGPPLIVRHPFFVEGFRFFTICRTGLGCAHTSASTVYLIILSIIASYRHAKTNLQIAPSATCHLQKYHKKPSALQNFVNKVSFSALPELRGPAVFEVE